MEENEMKRLSAIVLAFAMVLCFAAYAPAYEAYKVKVEHKGGNVTPTQAMDMWQKDKKNVHIVDVRTAPEYCFVGHPTMADHVPYFLWTGELKKSKGKAKYNLVTNPNFKKELLARYNPKTDTLIFMCRSGKRSCLASKVATDAGFDPKKIFNMMGGFEGDKIKCKFSAYKGQRMLGGWKNEGMPWTYSVDPKKAYAAK
ncbi:hypothetical protein X474_06660 [Dethiosulfatarculus sandiegensis]|uniref:Rhodanese domain-containing protein n=2 Tax=Dethiosulfatarculus sandiegensis TaxID=1429043 RepID=A0A0D2JGF6_9BACT|nr:hypothetical protein X474_06660 [Dethiosulfatarculus sandiegensis]